MDRAPGERIFGVETEFGCLVADPDLGTPEGVVEALKDYLFQELRLGALDQHSRDEVFEPAMSGGFLMNGARLYIDAVGSHLEYATAECRNLRDLVANDRAGQRQIVRAIKEMGLQDEVSVYNNSVDHFGGHTFGCHENYLVRADDDLLNSGLHLFYPFLVTRQIFAGVGRVGGHILAAGGIRPSHQEILENPVDYIWVSHVYSVLPDSRVTFQLSQRADHILKTIASRVRFNRALINPKWETLYTHDGMTRLHLLFGESNQNEFAYALKVGTTCLVLRLLEDNLVPAELAVAGPLAALRSISRDPSYRWLVQLQNGETRPAIDIQRSYLQAAQRYRSSSPDTDWVLDNWAQILDDLERDPMNCADRVDWVMKRRVVEQYMQAEGADWTDDALHSVDLEYHNIDPDKSLFHAVQEMGETSRVVEDVDIVMAMTDPPQNTRAKGRAKLVEQVMARKKPGVYLFDWNGVALDRYHYIEMPDPFQTYDHLSK
jgi:proteasome accessory factor A